MAKSNVQSVPPKRVLVVLYSQTGQLRDIVERILAPLRETETIALHVETLVPVKPFPFPWPFLQFLDAFPESAHLTPVELQPLSLAADAEFDLIILPYQVWFLAPSQPITAFLKLPATRKWLEGKPVVTLIACRNMWMLAQEKMRHLLADCHARLVDNIVLVDEHPTITTLLTTPLWLLTGQRNYFKMLPPAGISERSIFAARRFGLALRDAILQDAERSGLPMLTGLKAVNVAPELLVSEKAGTRSFYLWGRLLRWSGKPGERGRIPFLCLYVVFLVSLILTVIPISLSLQILFRPLLKSKLARVKAEYEQPSGSGDERMSQYEL